MRSREAEAGCYIPPIHAHLRAITVENYRSFKEPFCLELRPLTLVYGWNNVGKSAAVRLVKLLGDSLRDQARAPLDPINGPIYRDLVWKPAIAKPGPLRFGLEWDGESARSTVAQCVKFDRFGRPGEGWPRDVFADELELAELLSERQFTGGAWDGAGR